jgi:hypothetical protein
VELNHHIRNLGLEDLVVAGEASTNLVVNIGNPLSIALNTDECIANSVLEVPT